MSLRNLPLCLVALLASGPAAHAVGVKIGGDTAEVKLIDEPARDIQLDVYLQGKRKQSFEDLGSKLQPFQIPGQARNMLVFDLDRDGYEEFMIRTTQPPYVGSLWLFKFDREKKLFYHVDTSSGDRYTAVPLTAPIRVATNGELSFEEAGASVVLRWNGRMLVERKKQ